MDMPFRWVRFELSLGSVWTRRARFPGARALGGSSTWRLGGLSGRQLTGPVAEAPEVDLRSSAASRHQAELGVWCPGGAEANSSVSRTRSFRKKSYSKKTRPRAGVFVNPPTPWPNWQAPVSTRKTRPTIMERAVEVKTSRGECGFPAEAGGATPPGRKRFYSTQPAPGL